MAIHPPTSVQLLDAAIARDCVVQNNQTAAEALGALIGRWLLEHSQSPKQDGLALLAQIQTHLQDPEAFLARLNRLEAMQTEITREIGRTGRLQSPTPSYNPSTRQPEIEREL
jgi:hypothetical protein